MGLPAFYFSYSLDLDIGGINRSLFGCNLASGMVSYIFGSD